MNVCWKKLIWMISAGNRKFCKGKWSFKKDIWRHRRVGMDTEGWVHHITWRSLSLFSFIPSINVFFTRKPRPFESGSFTTWWCAFLSYFWLPPVPSNQLARNLHKSRTLKESIMNATSPLGQLKHDIKSCAVVVDDDDSKTEDVDDEKMALNVSKMRLDIIQVRTLCHKACSVEQSVVLR